MKEQEKQIKEMAKEIGNTWLVDLEGNTKDVCEVLDEADINNIARELYDKNYRKLPEDSVILTKVEKQKLLKEMYEQGRFDAIADLDKDGRVVLTREEKEEYESLKRRISFTG